MGKGNGTEMETGNGVRKLYLWYGRLILFPLSSGVIEWQRKNGNKVLSYATPHRRV